jgi:hypothetical protein
MAVPTARKLTVALPPAMATPQTPSLPSLPLALDPPLEPLAMDYGPSLAHPVEEPIDNPPIVKDPITTRHPACTRRPARRV